jgi:hypothetical protein
MKKLIFALLIPVLSCGLEGEIAFGPDKSATVDLEITFFPEMTSYLQDLGELTEESLSPFDPQRTLERLNLMSTVNDPTVTQDDPQNIRLRFGVVQIENFLFEATGEDPATYIRFERSGSIETVNISLTKENFMTLLQGFQEEIPPSAEIFLPTPEAPLTQDEYQDLMSYVLEPYTSDIEELLSKSKVDLTIGVPGNLTQVSQGSYSGKTWIFSLPLDRVLSLYEPLELSASYRF